VTAEAAFYTVSDARFFLGAAGLVNSLRLLGHDEPIVVLDCGLTDTQRELLAPESELVPGPTDVPGNLLKGIAPLERPAETMILVDADIVVTRPLGALIERAAGGEVLAFATGMDRFCPAWGELLDGEAAQRPAGLPYLCSALVAAGGGAAREIAERLERHRGAVDWERTYWRANDADYEWVHADQDLFNAVLATRVDPERVVELEGRLLAFPPFDGVAVADERSLRCAYPDRAEPYALHHWNAKPWLEQTHEGPYSQLLRRLLAADDVAIRVPEDEIPLRLRTGPLAYAERKRVNARERLRRHAARR
jgi:hypothetical protein